MASTAITHDSIELERLIESCRTSSAGAFAIFVGTVRDMNDGKAVTGMEYSAYEPMAARELAKIANECEAEFEGVRIAAVHRIGALAIGETSVAIVAAHAHRAPAYDASRFMIEQIKQRLPVWKKEGYVDGTREWVGQDGMPRDRALEAHSR